MTMLAIKHMSQAEKLKAMEELWESLSNDADRFESPAWHADALRETQQRYDTGLESPLDWTDAKQELRKRSK